MIGCRLGDRQKQVRAGGCFVALVLLAACGGGGGPASTPPPGSTVPPAPSPPITTPTPPAAPTPAPGTNFNTSEYGRSTAATMVNAITAYQKGASGAGVTIAVLDSGVDVDNAEFAGRISTASRDIAGTRGIDDPTGHGTSVAAVALAARDDSGMHGVAFGATLLALRTDTPGSCDNTDGCKHDDSSLARAVDVATTSGARIVNMSLGGSTASSALRQALARATRAGVMVVISAGNKDDDEPAPSPNPDPLAQVALDQAAANGLIVIAGAIGTAESSRQISTFSARAGIAANVYLAAPGYRVRSYDENGAQFLFSGTSYAAPALAGAAALLLQAFPHLSAAQIVDLLYRSADDAGDPGIDPIYGRGIVNLTRAFQPQGETALAGSQLPVALDQNASLGSAFGDGGQAGTALQGAVILDGFNRAFAVDLARTIAATPAPRILANRLFDRTTQLGARDTHRLLSFTITAPTSTRPWVGLAQTGLDALVGDRTQLRRGLVTAAIGARTRSGFAIGYAPETLIGSLTGTHRASYLTADPLSDTGLAARDGAAAAMHRQVGRWSFAAAAGHATLAGHHPGAPRASAASTATVAVQASRRLGRVDLSLGLAQQRESNTLLGSRLGAAFGVDDGAVTRFASLELNAQLGGGWMLSAGTRRGWTTARLSGGLITRLDTIRSAAWQLDLTKHDLLASGDRLGLRLAQPLRVAAASALLEVPIDHDYASRTTSVALRAANLRPSGRERDFEASYAIGLLGGELDANLYLRRDPGHVAERSDDLGGALRFTLAF